MRLLDRYITKKFLFTLSFPVVAFISLFIIIDLVERLSDYIDRDVPGLVIASYYFYYTPYIIVLMFPIAMLLAALFSVGQLSKYNELTAMKATGVSLYRILAPIFIIAFLLSLVMMLFAEQVVPVANQRKAEIKNQHIDRLPQNLPARPSNIYLQDHFETAATASEAQAAPNKRSRRVFIGIYNTETETAEKVSIQDYEGVFIVHRIDANALHWRDNTWKAVHGYERAFTNGSEVATKFDTLRLDSLFFTPDVLTKVQKIPEEMSYRELKQFIKDLTSNGGNPESRLVDLYLKISFPFANFIIVLFGAPLAVGRLRSSGAVGVALTLVIAFLYFGTVKTGQTLAQNGTIEPMVGAWMGNTIFFAAGLWVLFRARK